MPYLNLDLDYFDHPKTRRLIGLLGRGAGELPIRLWCYCGKYHAESGNLASYSAQEIESIVGWWGKENELIQALQKVGFIVKNAEGWSVKDWVEINGHLAAFKKRAKKASTVRWKNWRNARSYAQASLKQSPNHTNLPNQPNQLSLSPPTPSLSGLQRPTAEQVEEYAQTVGYALNGAKFVAFYESKGWKVGRAPMKDWKAAVRTWKISDEERKVEAGPPKPKEPSRDWNAPFR